MDPSARFLQVPFSSPRGGSETLFLTLRHERRCSSRALRPFGSHRQLPGSPPLAASPPSRGVETPPLRCRRPLCSRAEEHVATPKPSGQERIVDPQGCPQNAGVFPNTPWVFDRPPTGSPTGDRGSSGDSRPCPIIPNCPKFDRGRGGVCRPTHLGVQRVPLFIVQQPDSSRGTPVVRPGVPLHCRGTGMDDPRPSLSALGPRPGPPTR